MIAPTLLDECRARWPARAGWRWYERPLAYGVSGEGPDGRTIDANRRIDGDCLVTLHCDAEVLNADGARIAGVNTFAEGRGATLADAYAAAVANMGKLHLPRWRAPRKAKVMT